MTTNKQVALTTAARIWQARLECADKSERNRAGVTLLRQHGEKVTQLAEQLLGWLEQGEEQGR